MGCIWVLIFICYVNLNNPQTRKTRWVWVWVLFFNTRWYKYGSGYDFWNGYGCSYGLTRLVLIPLSSLPRAACYDRATVPVLLFFFHGFGTTNPCPRVQPCYLIFHCFLVHVASSASVLSLFPTFAPLFTLQLLPWQVRAMLLTPSAFLLSKPIRLVRAL